MEKMLFLGRTVYLYIIKENQDKFSKEVFENIIHEALEGSRRNMLKGLWTRQYLNDTELSQVKKKRKETMT